ncbi:MAG TPA: hypothetical protein VIV60_31305, partial [Polyangiaceae bacterium]
NTFAYTVVSTFGAANIYGYTEGLRCFMARGVQHLPLRALMGTGTYALVEDQEGVYLSAPVSPLTPRCF